MTKKTFNILCIGDIIGKAGRRVIERMLYRIIDEHFIDFVVANGENASGGAGLVPSSAEILFSNKINVITSGNHIWNKKEIYELIKNNYKIVRPANYHDNVPGEGIYYETINFGNKKFKIIVINLVGRIFMSPTECPFRKFDKIYNEYKDIENKIIIVDFHAEATSEKIGLGFYTDGRATVFTGTHTHIQTNDCRILNNGTGYITDLGMCGSEDSVIGFDKDIILSKFVTGLPERNKVCLKDPLIFNGAVFKISLETFKCIKAFPLYLNEHEYDF